MALATEMFAPQILQHYVYKSFHFGHLFVPAAILQLTFTAATSNISLKHVRADLQMTLTTDTAAASTATLGVATTAMSTATS